MVAADFLFSICSHPSTDHHDEISSGLMTEAVAVLTAPLGDSGVGGTAFKMPLTMALVLALLMPPPLAICADAEEDADADAEAAEEKIRASKAAISAAVAQE